MVDFETQASCRVLQPAMCVVFLPLRSPFGSHVTDKILTRLSLAYNSMSHDEYEQLTQVCVSAGCLVARLWPESMAIPMIPQRFVQS
jgi:hypothetical protein